MTIWRVQLSNIPEDLQKRFSVGPEIEAEANDEDEVVGGSFTFINRKDKKVRVDGAELMDTGISVHRI